MPVNFILNVKASEICWNQQIAAVFIDLRSNTSKHNSMNELSPCALEDKHTQTKLHLFVDKEADFSGEFNLCSLTESSF